jgi:glutathione synthase/RimK-type ligase-like ATP-grasp enzyme
LSRALFNLFPMPLMRATFARSSTTGLWRLRSITPIPVGEIPKNHGAFLRKVIENHFARRGPAGRAGRSVQYEHDLAILIDENERSPPSNREALKRFERAARANGFDVEFLSRDDYGRIAEFDALFIRATTAVNHHTYRFASRARAEGLVVIDDPESIIRCGNKVYLVELAKRLDLAIPPTMVVGSSARTDEIIRELGLPCVLKQPDSAFSEGVFRADTRDELAAGLQRLLSRSDLVVVQSFMPTEFDWRVGVFDRQPLFVCRYFMAEGHWQIYHHDQKRTTTGEFETIDVQHAPREVLQLALKTANAIGDGFYGVDIKTVNGRHVLMEINDNPNVDRGVEDAILGDTLYERIMKGLRARVDAGKQFKPVG